MMAHFVLRIGCALMGASMCVCAVCSVHDAAATYYQQPQLPHTHNPPLTMPIKVQPIAPLPLCGCCFSPYGRLRKYLCYFGVTK